MRTRIFSRSAALAGALWLAIGAVCITGCVSEPADTADAKPISTFHDIPGITGAEIEAVETLLATRQSFVFGSLSSPSAFSYADGSYGGVMPLLCERLSDLFGVMFYSEIYTWQELYDGLNDFSVDFTDALNMPTYMECNYYHSSPIASNKLSVFLSADRDDIISEYDLEDLKVGFYRQSPAFDIFSREFPYVSVERVDIDSADEMAAMLESGEIDAFIRDAATIFIFDKYDHIVKSSSFPDKSIPVTITTANHDLQPVISVITKYLMAGGKKEVEYIYDAGEHEYASHIIWDALSDEEHDYLSKLRTSGKKIPYGATARRYPVAYFDQDDNEFKGIAIDVLHEISLITGIEFYLNCDETTPWTELEEMLKNGEILLLSQLIPNEARSKYAIWPDIPYFTARYALLSDIEYPFLSIDQVPYAVVGYTAGTAEEATFHSWFPDSTNYKTFPTNDAGLDALQTGEIDLFFCLDYTMLYESNYRENPNQRINITFDEPVEPVPFGINKDEEILCSIISKTLSIIDTDAIARSWTSRMFDYTAKHEREQAAERANFLIYAIVGLAVVLVTLLLMYFRTRSLKKETEIQANSTHEANLNLRMLIDMAPVGIIITRHGDGLVLYSNKAGLDMFGYESFEKDIEGRTSIEFMPELQPDGRTSKEAVNALWQQDEGAEELYFKKHSGEAFMARIAFCSIFYKGEPSSLNVVEDMTAEREYQKALEDIAEHELEANQLKSRFLASMSHEIRTPMNAILGVAEILLLNENLPADIEESVGQIYESGYLLLSIINDILDLSRIEAKKLEISPIEYDFLSLISDTIKLNRIRYDSKAIDFQLDLDSNIPVNMYGDELRLKQILNNILSNAYKYTDKGEIKMSVSVIPLTDVDASGNDIAVVFRISDTGQGMTPKQLNILFDDYTRFNLEINRTTDGTGLGMSITKHLVELMGGEITVTSKPGEGSVFTVILPQKRIGNLVCGKNASENLQYIRPKTTGASRVNRIEFEHMPYGSVLIVDDVKSNIFVTQGMLMPYGLKIETASSGFEAIEKIDAGKTYDIIFMDYMMPEMSGIEATQILREKGYNNCIIALTADALAGQAEVFLENGFDWYISKPIDSRELNRALNRFIRNKKRKHS